MYPGINAWAMISPSLRDERGGCPTPSRGEGRIREQGFSRSRISPPPSERVGHPAHIPPSYIVVCFLLLALPTISHASTPREVIEQGNEHYAAERYEQALESYQQASQAVDNPFGAELLHNQAAAQFKLGKLEEARELWVRALALKDAAFEARARYNLGNCAYADALQALDAQQPEGIFEALDKAVEQYRDAIRLDPELMDARANLELATQLKQQLEDNATTQPQSQPSSDQQEQQDKEQQSTQDQQGEQGDSDEQEQEQESESPATQPESQQEQEQPPEPSTQPDQGPPPTQPAEQPQPEEEQSGQPPEDQQPLMIQMTPEEAERLLQKIRDAEKARREVLRQREAAKHRPVERDW